MEVTWAAVGSIVALAGLCLGLLGLIYSIKTDTQVLKQRADTSDNLLSKMGDQIEKIDKVLVILAENKGRMDLIEQRSTLQGQRVDDITRRVNTWLDQYNSGIFPALTPNR